MIRILWNRNRNRIQSTIICYAVVLLVFRQMFAVMTSQMRPYTCAGYAAKSCGLNHKVRSWHELNEFGVSNLKTWHLVIRHQRYDISSDILIAWRQKLKLQPILSGTNSSRFSLVKKPNHMTRKKDGAPKHPVLFSVIISQSHKLAISVL